MSGLALIYNRDGVPVDPSPIENMMAGIEHRGPDGGDIHRHASLALGHRHFWTTPEEVGERQPVVDMAAQLGILFDGRLDNRPELLAALERDDPEGRRLTDAALVLRAYERWGEDCFRHLLGPFAVAIHDAARRRVICARDSLGDRTLFYYLDTQVFVVASEERAVLAHPVVPEQVNETTLALYFSVMAPEDGATFFADVWELLPAHVMVVDADGVRTRRYWAFDGSRRLRHRSDAEYAEHFRELLEQSVACRMRSVTAPAVLMSGGLDSTSVAALAAQLMAGNGHSSRLRTVSYVFDDLPACDERALMDTMIARYDIEAHRFAGDGFWPLRDAKTWPWNPNRPTGNPYRRLMQRAYACARDAGARVLLSGLFGDHHYTGAETWLADLLAEGRWREAMEEIVGHVGRSGLRRVLSSASVRCLGRQVLDRMPGGRRLHRPRAGALAPWLTAYAAELVAGLGGGTQTVMAGRRSNQVERVLGATAARDASSGASDTSRAGVEIWYPYRDRRLVEFTLAVPGHQLYNRGRYKHVLRNAMVDLLPEEIRLRAQPTSLLPFYARGVLDREWSTVRLLLDGPDALWSCYVRPEYLAKIFPARIRSGLDGPETVLPWYCLTAELWRRGFEPDRFASQPAPTGTPFAPGMFDAMGETQTCQAQSP